MDAPRRFSMKHNRNGLGFYDGLEEDADGYLMTVAEHERLMAEARAKALEDAAKLANCGCECREAMLSTMTETERWTTCGCHPCGALVAAAIRAMKD